MIKEIKYSGYTATPSDYECPDGDLAAAVNLIPEEGSLRPIAEPADVRQLGSNETLLYVHYAASNNNYIVKQEQQDNNNNTIVTYGYYRGASPLTTIPDITGTFKSITSVGNVLVISTSTGLFFLLFKAESTSYVNMSDENYGPFPKVRMAFDIVKNVNGKEHHLNSEDIEYVPRETMFNHIAPKKDDTLYFFTTTPHYQDGIVFTGTGGSTKTATDFSFVLKCGFLIYFDDPNFRRNVKRWRLLFGNATQIDWNDNAYAVHLAAEYVEPMQLSIQVEFRDDLPSGNHTVYCNLYMRDKPDPEIEGFIFNENNLRGHGGELMSIVNTEMNERMDNGNFVMPFFVRYAIRLKDEKQSIVDVSAPILMVPNIGYAPWFEIFRTSNQEPQYYAYLKYYYGQLRAKLVSQNINHSKWKDIVESVCIYISEPIYTYNQIDDCKWFASYGHQYFHIVNWSIAEGTMKRHYESEITNSDGIFARIEDGFYKKEKEIYNELSSKHTFRLYAEIPIENINYYTQWETVIPIDGAKPNMYEGELLDEPNISAYMAPAESRLLTYNSRLIMAENKARLYEDFDAATLTQRIKQSDGNDSTRSIIAKVKLQLGEAVKYAYSRDVLFNNEQLLWFYYPNPNAVEATIYVRTTIGPNQYTYSYITIPLVEHGFLPGACWLCSWTTTPPAYLQSSSEDWNALVNEPHPYVNRNNVVRIYPADSPFSLDTQILTIGSGNIIGIAAAAKALSQGQFGQFPLYAFTSDGVWALGISNEGQVSAKQVITQDVVLGDGESITQIDTAVLFATDRGIMMLSGSNAICISDTISDSRTFSPLFEGIPTDPTAIPNNTIQGFDTVVSNVIDTVPAESLYFANLLAFIRNCRMLYDYTHQRIIIFNPARKYAYTYSLKSKQWGQMASNITGKVNSYPDALAVVEKTTTTGSTTTTQKWIVNYSLTTTGGNVGGLLITRPIKLDAPDVLKTIDTIIQRGHFRKGNIKSILYGSRDLFNWHLVYSSTDHYLRGFRGTPYKYFRIVLITQLAAGESIHGCTIQYKPRMLDQPR